MPAIHSESRREMDADGHSQDTLALTRTALPQVRRKEARSVSVGLRCSACAARAGRAMRAHKSNSASRLIANDFRLLWH